jgi:hypothetical protein
MPTAPIKEIAATADPASPLISYLANAQIASLPVSENLRLRNATALLQTMVRYGIL